MGAGEHFFKVASGKTLIYFGVMAVGVVVELLADTSKTSHFNRLGEMKEGGYAGLDPTYNLQVIFLCALCLVADWIVLDYHFGRPPHPKFLLLPKRRFFIAVHIISGTLEILALTLAFFASDPTLLARAGAVLALAGHVPSASAQTPIVFGVKTIMVPFYVLFIAQHAVSALLLLLRPTSLVYLVKTFVALHGYAWVRIAVGLFEVTGVLRQHEYTVAVILGSSVVNVVVIGPTAQVLYIVAVFVFHLLEPKLRALCGGGDGSWWKDSRLEAERDFVTKDPATRLATAFYAEELSSHGGGGGGGGFQLEAVLRAAREQGVSERELARAVFGLMDSEKSDEVSGKVWDDGLLPTLARSVSSGLIPVSGGGGGGGGGGRKGGEGAGSPPTPLGVLQEAGLEEEDDDGSGAGYERVSLVHSAAGTWRLEGSRWEVGDGIDVIPEEVGYQVERAPLRPGGPSSATFTFEQFYREEWPSLMALGAEAAEARKAAAAVAGNGGGGGGGGDGGGGSEPRRHVLPNNMKARLMFSLLDVDRSGALSVGEMEEMIRKWGLPERESQEYMRRFDDDRNGEISLREFEINFQPVWEYLSELVADGRLLMQ